MTANKQCGLASKRAALAKMCIYFGLFKHSIQFIWHFFIRNYFRSKLETMTAWNMKSYTVRLFFIVFDYHCLLNLQCRHIYFEHDRVCCDRPAAYAALLLFVKVQSVQRKIAILVLFYVIDTLLTFPDRAVWAAGQPNIFMYAHATAWHKKWAQYGSFVIQSAVIHSKIYIFPCLKCQKEHHWQCGSFENLNVEKYSFLNELFYFESRKIYIGSSFFCVTWYLDNANCVTMLHTGRYKHLYLL